MGWPQRRPDEQAESIVKFAGGRLRGSPYGKPEERLRWWANRSFRRGGNLAPNYTSRRVILRSKLIEVLSEVAAVGRGTTSHANVFTLGWQPHPLICYDESIPGMSEKAWRAGSEIPPPVCGWGSIGEHGIGIEKMADMAVLFTPDELAVQKSLHDVLTHDLCNRTRSSGLA
jgi:glycolate oxidase